MATKRANADRRDGTIVCQVGALVRLPGGQCAPGPGRHDLVSIGDDGGYLTAYILGGNAVSLLRQYHVVIFKKHKWEI